MIFIIIILTFVISFFSFKDTALLSKLHFSPTQILHHNQYYRMITYGFVHADWGHLIVNMFVLYSFGNAVMFYSKLIVSNPVLFFIALYFGGLFFSTIFALIKHKNNYAYAAVGASGAVSAVVFASILFHPMGSIRFIFLPIDIPAFVFGILYLVYSAYMAKKAKDNIGHDAHFFGALYGLFLPVLLKPALLSNFISQIFGLYSF